MVAAQLCLDHPGAGLMTMGHCLRPASQASVRGMEGSDALLAARLAAGDDRALADVFDQLAPSVFSGALRVLGNGSAAQDVVQDVFVELWRQHPEVVPSGEDVPADLRKQLAWEMSRFGWLQPSRERSLAASSARRALRAMWPRRRQAER